MAPSSLIQCLFEEEVLDQNATIRDGFPLIRKISGLVMVSFYFVNVNAYLEVILHSKTSLSDNSFMLYASGNLEISISEGLPYTCNFLLPFGCGLWRPIAFRSLDGHNIKCNL